MGRNYEEDYQPHYSDKDRKGRKAKNTSGGTQGSQGSNAQKDQAGQGSVNNQGSMNYGEDYPEQEAGRKKRKHTVGKVLAGIQGVASIVLAIFLLILNILPVKFLIVVLVALIVLWIFAFFSQFTRSTHVVGKIESVIMCVLLIFGCYYLMVTNGFLTTISGSTTKIDNIIVVVLDDDPAETLQDAADYTFGIQASVDRTNVDATIEEVNDLIGGEIAIQEYDSLMGMIEAFYNGEVGAIIYNEAFNDTIEDTYETFEDDIRVLKTVEIQTVIDISDTDVDVTLEPFTVYVTGIDTYGDISTTGRSDVNILITVNPTTKQILLTTTPRDYYVELVGVSNGQLDKLTHAGIYGVDCSVSTLEQLYSTEIDYYVKVNFTSVVELVDLLGGIEVYSEYSFSSVDGEHSFVAGYNTLDGEATLAFVRERKNLSGGDNQRGKNQQAVITALIQKIISPSILANYTSILSSLSGNFETNMTSSEIKSLVKMQLSDGASWNIVSQAVTGTDSYGYCYSSSSQSLYVMIPDDESVAEAAAQIQAVLDGEILEEGTTTDGSD